MCCNASLGHTCLPWILERAWPLLLADGGGASPSRCPYPVLLAAHQRSPQLELACSHVLAARGSAVSRLTDPMNEREYRTFLLSVLSTEDDALRGAAAR